MKKSVCMFLTIGLILSTILMMVSCTAEPSVTETTEPTKAATQSPTAAAAEPAATEESTKLTDEAIELSVWTGQLVTVEDFETNEFTLFYEELTGVHINWITANHSEAATKLNLSLSSGDYPDIYANYGFSASQIVEYGVEAGVFIPLNDLIDEYTQYAKMFLEKDSNLKEMITAPDGNIYTLFYYRPRLLEAASYREYYKMWIFEPWLEASGLEMPTTVDELTEVLIYFRDHDLNGNGDATDEIPMMSNYQYADPVYVLSSPYQFLPGDFLLAEDGEISFTANTDEFREALKYINMLCEEGLLSEETYVQDLNTYRSITSVTSEEEMVVGVTFGPTYARFITQSIYADAYEDFTAIAPLALTEDGVRQTVVSEIIPSFRGAITSTCEYPEIAIQWMDGLLDRELQLVVHGVGYEDVHWTRVSDEVTDDNGILYQLISDNPLIPSGSSTQNAIWQNWTAPYYDSELYAVGTEVYEEGSDSYMQNLKQGSANDQYAEYGVSTGIPRIVWNTDTDLETEFTELKSLIGDYVKQTYTQFILGSLDIDDDAAWQAYLDELDNMGLGIYQELAEEYYFGD